MLPDAIYQLKMTIAELSEEIAHQGLRNLQEQVTLERIRECLLGRLTDLQKVGK